MTTSSPEVIAVDLAAVHSAVVIRVDGGVVTATTHSPEALLNFLSAVVSNYEDPLIVVEDVPHHLRFDTTLRRVVRLQGELLATLGRPILFVPPASWQRHFPGVWRGKAAGAIAAAARLGYESPLDTDSFDTLTGKPRQQARNLAKKEQWDLADAFLISEFARDWLAGNVSEKVCSTLSLVRVGDE